MKIKYTRNARWLKPYVDSVKDLVPMHRLKEVMGFKVPLEKDEKSAATIIRYFGSNYFKITIRLWEPVFKTLGGKKFKKIRHSRASLASSLDSLAHELAHMVHWEHTPEHLELQSKILIRFARRAKKFGVKDTYDKKVYHRHNEKEEEQF